MAQLLEVKNNMSINEKLKSLTKVGMFLGSDKSLRYGKLHLTKNEIDSFKDFEMLYDKIVLYIESVE